MHETVSEKQSKRTGCMAQVVECLLRMSSEFNSQCHHKKQNQNLNIVPDVLKEKAQVL
jgi:hypothetical protein